MDEEFFNKLVKLLLSMDKKIDEIHDKVVPIMTDVSKHLAEAKRLANKGKKPRKQPKKKFDKVFPDTGK